MPSLGLLTYIGRLNPREDQKQDLEALTTLANSTEFTDNVLDSRKMEINKFET